MGLYALNWGIEGKITLLLRDGSIQFPTGGIPIGRE
jgi:hypothetical protein